MLNPVRIIVGAAFAGGVAIFGAANAFDDATQRDQSGQITTAGGLGVLVIHVGDCVQIPDGQLVMSFEAVPCTDPHDAQAYAKFDISDVTTFDQDEVNSRGEEQCVDRWQNVIGTVSETDTEHALYLLSPTALSWQVGDREVVCFVTNADGSRVQGSTLRSG